MLCSVHFPVYLECGDGAVGGGGAGVCGVFGVGVCGDGYGEGAGVCGDGFGGGVVRGDGGLRNRINRHTMRADIMIKTVKASASILYVLLFCLCLPQMIFI